MPQNFFSGKLAWKGFDFSKYQISGKIAKENYEKNLTWLYSTYKDELKVSYSCSHVLGLHTFAKT